MTWVEVFAVFLVSHLVGDFLLQTDWQARHKREGLGAGGESRRALLAHVVTYTAAFVPALVWIALEQNVALALGIGLAIAIPHLIQDDGRLVEVYSARVKGLQGDKMVRIAVDQTFHILALLGAALLVTA